MRLIDADELIPSLKMGEVNADTAYGDGRNGGIYFAIWRIGQMPTVEPKTMQWIPVKSRPMDEEERKEWCEKVGYELEGDDAVIYTSQLPDDGQECIVCTKWGNVFIDTFQNDPDYGCAFEDHGDMDGITAWMPLPKPWKGEKDG